VNVTSSPATVDYSASFQRAIELIGKRWTGVIVRALLRSPLRFNQLLMGIPDINDRVLTERLRELEDEGLVERIAKSRPVTVTYRVTPSGRAVWPVIAAVDEWAAERPPAVGVAGEVK
jgi:DNA-binding HxlR family transcriptional regulator